jgi:hypothetical protein
METELIFTNRNAVCVRRGPVLYSLEVPETGNTTAAPWNYVLALTEDRRLMQCEVVGEGQHQKLLVLAYRSEEQGWGRMRLDAPWQPADPPHSPVSADSCYFPQKIALVPLARTKMKITQFPWCVAGYWRYRPYECEAWQLKQMKAEADLGILHFGYPGSFLNLEKEPDASFGRNRCPGFECIPGFPGKPPHRIERRSTSVALGRHDGLYDAGRLELGYIRAESKVSPELFVGESVAEAMSSSTNGFEQSVKMVDEGGGRWRSEIPLAVRYFRFGNPVEGVRLETQVDWREASGSYACGNARFAKMWRIGRDTLRICNRTFLIDGIKRDRLPWAADLVIAMLSQAYTFGDPEPVKRHIAAIGSADPKVGQVNGIIAFSLWWVVAHDVFQRYFGDMDYLRLHYPRICARMKELEAHEDSRGFLVKNLGWDFMDWTDNDGGNLKSEISRQAIYYWALQSAVRLAERMGDGDLSKHWRDKARSLKANVLAAGMDGTRQSRILSILSGLAEGEKAHVWARELASDKLPPTVTPYMSTYEVMALVRMNETEAAVRKFESVWGEMADANVDSYWEGWDSRETGDERYIYYGRPFGKSLCHAWSSSPAFLIPGVFLGICPTKDGWRDYKVDVKVPSFAKEAVVVIPSASGVITVDFN